MKKFFLFAMTLVLSVSVMAQQKIQLRSADKAECVKSDMTSLKASFSFSTIDAQDYQSERGTFSWLSLPNTVIGGNEGDPQIPVVNELIAVPFGANPRIEITSYSSTDYRLEDYGIHTLVPRQPSLRKDQRPEEVPFVYNTSAYQTRGLRSAPQAVVSVNGTMRGIQIGKMTIEPVSYDPVNNTLRVFNDIEVTVHFDGADATATEEMLLKTYSPYFNGIYNQMFNGRAVRDAYSQHPDLYTTPVKMLVITTPTYANNATFQNWVIWKKQKGIYVDVYTTSQTGTTASAIKSFITTQYNQNHPTFLVIVGDSGDVTQSTTGSASGKYTDLYYSSIDGDIFPDMYTSRMPVSSSNELTNMLTKTLQYEQYTMPDPSYLDETLLIAGWDATWTPRVGKPTIQYANNYYYNSEHGITPHVFLTTGEGQTTCYTFINQVGFVNYTAHGSQTGWADPAFSVSSVNNMTNTDKYFWAMGNCCLAADWGYNGTCFAEAMVRAENKGAWGYIGSCPSTYWWEDYYFGVGATTVTNQMPTMDQTQTGVYDAMFDDDAFNTLNAVPFFGNIAVVHAHANGYSSSSVATDTYYWEAYHTLGDGSVMPYHKNPSANNVSHASAIGIGLNTFTVNADPGSYVAISKNNEILGVAQVDGSGTVNVPITPVTSGGDVLVVVTRNQRQPYMQTIPAVSLEGPYISIDVYTPNTAHVGDNTNLSISFKNVGADATTGNTTVTLTAGDTNATIVGNTGTQTFGALAANATTTVSGFQFRINSGVADGTIVPLHYRAVNGSNTWEGNFNITAGEAVLEYQNMAWDGGFTPGQTLTLTAKFKNTGHYQATNAVATMSTSSNFITINTSSVNVGTIAVDQEVSCQFSVTFKPNCPETAQIPVTFTLNAAVGLTASGNEILKNACNVVFVLVDKYNDGWDGNATLKVSFSDGTPDENLTVVSGESPKTYNLEIGNGVHVTLAWVKGSYDGECSFTVSYDGGLTIFEMSQGTNPNSGVLYEFDCNCAAASQTFTVTATSSNTEHGTVTGGGEFNYGESCTVTATHNDDYFFVNWTENGTEVSSSASYTFTVTIDRNLVANFAEGILIGDGGTETHDYLPSYNYYNHSLTEQIYTPEELGDAGFITSIAFYNGGAEKTLDYEFYMKPTEKALFSNDTDWEAVTERDLVFSGRVTMVANDWTTIVFSTPFAYDGTSNVVLVTNKNTDYSYSPHMSCLVFDAPSQAIYAYSDGVSYNPMTPPTSYGNSGSNEFHNVLSVKNQLLITKTGFDGCMNATPTSVEVGNISHSTANVTWTGFSESYNVSLGVVNSISINEGFAESIPSGWTNDAAYPWTIVNGHIQSSNAGVHSSTSSISVTVKYYEDDVIEFDAECMGEGMSTIWDKCMFSIDGEQQFSYGANVSGWNHYSFDVAAGQHTFTWSYTKDSSVNPTGDYFAVDNVLMKVGEITWNDPVAVEDAEYTFRGLTPETDYCVRVKGVCDDVESAWSEAVMFSTTEAVPVIETVLLSQGWNWWSTNLEITLDAFMDAISAAVGTDGIATIKSQLGSITYQNGQWNGNGIQALDVRQMYEIQTNVSCEITLTGIRVNPEDCLITIQNSNNWIGYLPVATMTLSEAFGTFPVEGDMVKSKTSSAVYENGQWIGQLSVLQPGQGYIYKSNATGDRRFTFPTSAK